MYLARRETGGPLRVYQLKTNDHIATAWPFDPWENPNGSRVNPALCGHGIAATGNSRSAAIANLRDAEDDGLLDGPIEFVTRVAIP